MKLSNNMLYYHNWLNVRLNKERGQVLTKHFPIDNKEPSNQTATEGTPLGVDDVEEDGDGEDEEDLNPWNITEVPHTASDRYGECLRPVTPALDPDLSPQSGMRFGKRGIVESWSYRIRNGTLAELWMDLE